MYMLNISFQQSNGSVYWSKLYKLKKIHDNNSCWICAPRKGENARRYYKHGMNSKYKSKK